MRSFLLYICTGLLMLSAGGCRDLSNPTLPDGTQSPDTYHSREGGLMLAESAFRMFRGLWIDMMITTGLLTDELSNSNTNSSALDQRNLGDGISSSTYASFHKLRGQAQLARGVLAEYAPDLSPAVRARLYAFEGYAELWLAELYCSGVSLSTIDFKGDYTYRPASTTEEVYTHAITLFDSALALGADSAAVLTLAQVGKARAFMGLGEYTSAEAAVASMQPNDAYRLRISFFPSNTNIFAYSATVSDQEGVNGLPFRSSGDPRTASSLQTLPLGASQTRTVFFPTKYPAPNDSNWVNVASGVDAGLVKAEAALQRGAVDTWLSLLNTLRTTGTYTRVDTTYTDTTRTTIARTDTIWAAGTGGVAGLRKLEDPGTERARIALQFSERAAWLFVTGQRQGDLRRLVRNYGWAQDQVYPTGVYPGMSTTGMYGNDITVPIPEQEGRNPLFRGCLNRE